MTRLAWYLGNLIAQIVFAFRIGYRDGSVLHPNARPDLFRKSSTSTVSGDPK